jgi:hypothetical protein
MGLLIHLSAYNTSYGQKKGQESKCQFDSWPCMQVVNHMFLEFFWQWL